MPKILRAGLPALNPDACPAWPVGVRLVCPDCATEWEVAAGDPVSFRGNWRNVARYLAAYCPRCVARVETYSRPNMED